MYQQKEYFICLTLQTNEWIKIQVFITFNQSNAVIDYRTGFLGYIDNDIIFRIFDEQSCNRFII